jgi:hypothetical protein
VIGAHRATRRPLAYSPRPVACAVDTAGSRRFAGAPPTSQQSACATSTSCQGLPRPGGSATAGRLAACSSSRGPGGPSDLAAHNGPLCNLVCKVLGPRYQPWIGRRPCS